MRGADDIVGWGDGRWGGEQKGGIVGRTKQPTQNWCVWGGEIIINVLESG